MVSVFDGQLSRTWFYEVQGRKHIISLYHDTITGVRSAMIDYKEIRGSSGNSSILMESKGHRIFFTVADLPGYLEIKRSGWTGFAYSCVINDKKVPEATETVKAGQDPIFRPKIIESTLTPDENSEYPITWYVVRTTRLTDNAVTTVHRRFREFAELNSQVKQNLKGHHLRDILPPLPEKPLKSMTDHRDPQFIQDRQQKLELYIASLVAIPHVSDMICVKAFLGLMDHVREYSISFHVPMLGLSLIPSGKPDQEGVPVIIGSIQKPEVGQGVMPGDSISKINGIPVATMNFNGVVARIKNLQRPIIIHFIQLISGKVASATESPFGTIPAQYRNHLSGGVGAGGQPGQPPSPPQGFDGLNNTYDPHEHENIPRIFAEDDKPFVDKETKLNQSPQWNTYNSPDPRDQGGYGQSDQFLHANSNLYSQQNSAAAAASPSYKNNNAYNSNTSSSGYYPVAQTTQASVPAAQAPVQHTFNNGNNFNNAVYDYRNNNTGTSSPPPPPQAAAPAPAPAPAPPKPAVPIGWD